MTQPSFIDNLDGNTLANALRERIEHLAATLVQPVNLSIATGYFNPGGFALLANALEKLGNIRLLLGAEPIPPPARPIRHLGDPRGERFERKLTDDALRLNEEGLARDRDLLGFTTETDSAVKRLLGFLESGKIEVRRYEKQFLHGKAFLFSHENGTIAGSSNFTGAGLTTNLELNLGQYQPEIVRKVEQWFERLWSEGVPYDLGAIYEARFQEYSPYLIYLRVLWERYHDELLAEASQTGLIHLTRFQTDGLDRAKRILAKYNGVLIADGVGLGKTFVAGELLTEIIQRNRQRALLIAPAALRDGTWERFQNRFMLYVETISFEQLTAAMQGSDGAGLKSAPSEYSLIIVDEAHAFRSTDSQRSQALRKLIRGDPPKKVVLMTATPVNNSLWDLHDLLGYFIDHDAVFADAGIPSLRRRFEEASREDPFTLKPDTLFDVLDATTVRRTRHFVQRYYPEDRITLPGGEQVVIHFPQPHVESRSYDLEKVLPGFFYQITEILAPEEGEPKLTMARYWPTRYSKEGDQDNRQAALIGLIRSGLLKRFESSVKAFADTTRRMVDAHTAFLDGLEQGVLISSPDLAEISETDSDEAWEELIATSVPLSATEIEVKRLAADVRQDRDLLQQMHDRAAKVSARKDPKLRLLAEKLKEILRDSETRLTEEQKRNSRKVLVFSYFADTVEWIAEFLNESLARDDSLAPYRGRLAVVHGDESYGGVTREKAVFGFAPKSAEAPVGQDADLYDILVTTDVLAEGMNLQQASRIINYDLPWNPMRLVQRHGRIDRIGSPHSDVFITCIFPDAQLDELLTLEERIRRKLAQAAASIGLENEVIPKMDVVERNFADTRQEIEAIRQGDATIFETGGEDIHAHSGEEYRQELRKGLERYRDQIERLPGAAGSGLRRGTRRGHFFCARIDNRSFLRFVPADGMPMFRDSLACLRQITCTETTPRCLPDDLREGAYSAWARARDDIYQEWQRGTDPANLQPKIRPLFLDAAAHIKSNIPPEMTLAEADRLVDILEAPYSLRIERSIRSVFNKETLEGIATTRALAEKVKELGLQPWKPPEALPPIDLEDVVLVVWMAVESEN